MLVIIIYKNKSCVSLIGSRYCILYQRPIRSKSAEGLGALGAQESWKIWRHCTRKMSQHEADASVITLCRYGGNRGFDSLLSPSSQQQIIQQLILANYNNSAKSLTSISLLQSHCTHVYEKFAVRERYHSAFAVTCLVCVPQVSVLSAPPSTP